jgi:hypothetical protein
MRLAALLVGTILVVAACGSTATPAPTTPTAFGLAASAAASAGASAAAASAAATTAQPTTSPPAATPVPTLGTVPASCQDLLVVVAPYTGNVSGTRSLGKPQHLSCEFQYGDGKGVLIINIGAGGTQAAFDALKAGTASGGRTVADVLNVGAAAFSVSKKGVPAGMTSLGANGILYVTESNLLFNQDIALIRDLLRLP